LVYRFYRKEATQEPQPASDKFPPGQFPAVLLVAGARPRNAQNNRIQWSDGGAEPVLFAGLLFFSLARQTLPLAEGGGYRLGHQLGGQRAGVCVEDGGGSESPYSQLGL